MFNMFGATHVCLYKHKTHFLGCLPFEVAAIVRQDQVLIILICSIVPFASLMPVKIGSNAQNDSWGMHIICWVAVRASSWSPANLLLGVLFYMYSFYSL